MVAARENRFTSASDRVVAFSAPPFCPVCAAHSARASACRVRPCTVRAQRCRHTSPAPPPAICTSSMTTWNCAAGAGATCANTAAWFGADCRAPPFVTRGSSCRVLCPASIRRAACRLSAALHVLVLVAISHEHLYVVVHTPRRLLVPRVSRSPSSAHARAQACTPRRRMPRRALWTGLTPAPPASLFAVPPEWRARCR